MKRKWSFLVCLSVFLFVCAIFQQSDFPHIANFRTQIIGSRARLAAGTQPQSAVVPPAKLPATRQQQFAAMHAIPPLSFEANQGQANPSVKFFSRTAGFTLLLTEREAVLAIGKASTRSFNSRDKLERRPALRLKFAAPSAIPHVAGVGELPGKVNYLLGNDPAKWRHNVPLYSKVRYEQIDPGVDLVFHGDQQQLEFDLLVSPGADPSRIGFELGGADELTLDEQGDLILRAGGDEIRMHKPAIYQQAGNVRRPIQGGFVMKGKQLVGFRVAPYDTAQSLVIDPTILYATFLGGAGSNQARSIALDQFQQVYIGGSTTNIATFPETNTSLGSTAATENLFVAKINPTATGASSLIFLTFLGGQTPISGSGTCGQTGGLVAVDESQASPLAVVGGVTTCSDFPIQNGSGPAAGGANDLTLTRLTADGSALDFGTYFGGNGQEATVADGSMFVDSAGNIVFATDTSSTNLPLTANAFVTSPGFPDAFVAEVNRTGTVQYLTYLGVSDPTVTNPYIGGIAKDSSGAIYVTGGTGNEAAFYRGTPPNGTNLANGFENSGAGGPQGLYNGILLKLDPSKTGNQQVVYATYFGGFDVDPRGLAVDPSSGLVIVTGVASSAYLPSPDITPNAYQTTQPGPASGTAPFVSAVDTTQTGKASLLYSTYFGGSSGSDGAYAIAYDPLPGPVPRVVIAGETASTDFPLLNPLQSTLAGTQNAFIAELDVSKAGAASLLFSTYLGGGVAVSGQNDSGRGVVTDSSHNIYVTGRTPSANFFGNTESGVTVNLDGFQTSCTGCGSNPPEADAFLAVISPAQLPTTGVIITPSSTPTAPFNFGNVNLGSTTAQTFTVTNNTTASITIGSSNITETGSDSSYFQVSPNSTCITTPTVVVSGSCTVGMTFAPTTTRGAGTYGPVTLDVAFTGASGSPLTETLTGTGVNPSAPIATLSTTQTSWGVAFISIPAVNAYVGSLSNTGQSALTITGIQVIPGANTGANDFTYSTTAASAAPAGQTACPTSGSLAAGASCALDLVSKLSNAGMESATIQITDDSNSVAGSVQTVTFSGVVTDYTVSVQSGATTSFTVSQGQSAGPYKLQINPLPSPPINGSQFPAGTPGNGVLVGCQIVSGPTGGIQPNCGGAFYVTVNADPTKFTVTVNTTAPSSAFFDRFPWPPGWAPLALLAMLALLGMLRAKLRMRPVIALAPLALFFLLLSACMGGGGGGGGGGQGLHKIGTPTGTYTFNVEAMTAVNNVNYSRQLPLSGLLTFTVTQ